MQKTTTYWRLRKENIDLKCKNDKLWEAILSNNKVSNIYFIISLIVIIGLTIALFIF